MDRWQDGWKEKREGRMDGETSEWVNGRMDTWKEESPISGWRDFVGGAR